MFDGSVRFIRKDISETAFWGMTPATLRIDVFFRANEIAQPA